VEQVPVLFVPQHGSPEAPHAPHWLVVAAIMHENPVVQAVTPPSPPPPIVGQHSSPLPPHAAHVPAKPKLSSRPPQARPDVHVPLPPVPQQG